LRQQPISLSVAARKSWQENTVVGPGEDARDERKSLAATLLLSRGAQRQAGFETSSGLPN
jgi:hypothetical protein